MRVVKEIVHPKVKISIFSWNQKYLIKYEQGPLEQTYKIDELDIMNEEDLNIFLADKFIDNVIKLFNDMGQQLSAGLSQI